MSNGKNIMKFDECNGQEVSEEFKKIVNGIDWHVRCGTIYGDPWFVAADVCECLEIANNRDAMSRLDDDEKGVVLTDTPGGKQELVAINESGLYVLVLGSRKKEAKPFKRWITHDVIPSIRKYHAYITEVDPSLIDTDPKGYAAALQQQNTYMSNKINQLTDTINANADKIRFHDTVVQSNDSVHVGVVAKMIADNGYKVGQNRLYKWLRKNAYLMKKESMRNCPYQCHVNRGLFEVTTYAKVNADGSVTLTYTPMVTPKGQDEIINAYIKDQEHRKEIKKFNKAMERVEDFSDMEKDVDGFVILKVRDIK